jgi:hypothetical protein
MHSAGLVMLLWIRYVWLADLPKHGTPLRNVDRSSIVRYLDTCSQARALLHDISTMTACSITICHRATTWPVHKQVVIVALMWEPPVNHFDFDHQ